MRARKFLQFCFCAAIAGAVLHTSSLARGQTLTQIRESGPRANRLNVVFLSEGYTAEELATEFPADAQRTMEGLLATEPFNEYRNYFNFFTIAVASAQSGSDQPSRGIYRDTYFNSSFESYGLPHSLTIPPNNFIGNYAEGHGKIDRLLMQFLPDYDLVMILVNDAQYGGSAKNRTSIVSMHQLSREIAEHEIGHSLADLADEYQGAGTPDVPIVEHANVTQQTNRELIKWRSWILPTTPIPTPTTTDPNTGRPVYENVIGLFEGANYNSTGWYRPKHQCKMRIVSDPFCEVCTEAMTLSISGQLAPVDARTPEERSLMLYMGESTTFSVRRLQPRTHDLELQWFIDDVPVSGATGEQFRFASGDAPPGRHTVRVQVTDRSPFVRNDPLKVLSRSEQWTVTLNDTPRPSSPLALNISTRLAVQTGEGVMIGGFIITGTDPKRVIIRAIGPSLGPGLGNELSPANIAQPLRDPVLELLDGSGAPLALNDNWRDTQEEEVRETTIPPSHRLESAIVATLVPGAYTAKVSGNGATSGIGLVEVYDIQQNSTAALANISTRGVVQTGEHVMIGGFIIGTGAMTNHAKVVVRVIGPSLRSRGIAGPLNDPTLELRDGNGALLASNDNWKDSQESEIAGTGLAPDDERESAIAATLPSGAYTAVITGKDGTTGVGLFELYNVRQ